MEGEPMGMRGVEGDEIVIPTGENEELKPGGLYLMCIGKSCDFAVCDTVPVTLEFAVAGEFEAMAKVEVPGGY